MVSSAYHYQFRRHRDLSEAEATLQLALVAAEGLFGEARVRMDGGYSLDRRARTLSVDACAAVGKVLNAVFCAFIIKEFGQGSFTVRRTARKDCSCGPGPPGFCGTPRRVTGTGRSRERWELVPGRFDSGTRP